MFINTTDMLPKEEFDLLTRFEKLTAENRIRLMERAEMLLESQTDNSN